MSDIVEWQRTLTVELLKETAEVHGPRGWAEGTCVHARVEKEGDDLLIEIEGARYLFRRAVIEAIYDMHQDIPYVPR